MEWNWGVSSSQLVGVTRPNRVVDSDQVDRLTNPTLDNTWNPRGRIQVTVVFDINLFVLLETSRTSTMLLIELLLHLYVLRVEELVVWKKLIQECADLSTDEILSW